MAGPAWLTVTFAVLMVTVAAYCTGRLVLARRWHRPTELETDVAHIIMGLAMAGTLVCRLRILPSGAWEAIFAAGAAWFAWRLLRARRATPSSPWRALHPAPHLVQCAAMLYMFLAQPTPTRAPASALAGMTAIGSRYSSLALLLALFMFCYVVWVGDRLTTRAPAFAAPGSGGPAGSGGGAPVGRLPLAPRCAALCKIAMGITMGYMLILML